MSRDYKTPPRKSGPTSGFSGSSFALGALVGLLVGLGIALAVAWYVNKVPSPFVTRVPPKGDAAKAVPDDKAAKAKDEKLRLDFHDILTGKKDPDVEGKGAKDAKDGKEAKAAPSTPVSKEAFYLQAGAFTSAQEADNLKARLALLGHEASVQSANIPDKGAWHRVRLGPYGSVEELTRVRDALKQNGIDTTLVKIRDAEAKSGK
ncbi:MAG: SPOR domain-containing protein [Burkholderiales bacterium]